MKDTIGFFSQQARGLTILMVKEFSLSYKDSCALYNLNLETAYYIDSFDFYNSEKKITNRRLRQYRKLEKKWRRGINRLISKKQRDLHHEKMKELENSDLIDTGFHLLIAF